METAPNAAIHLSWNQSPISSVYMLGSDFLVPIRSCATLIRTKRPVFASAVHSAALHSSFDCVVELDDGNCLGMAGLTAFAF